MSADRSEGRAIRIASVGHVFFAVTLIGLGILGLIKGELGPTWPQLPKSTPAPGREALAYICALIYLGCGLGLLWRRTAAVASRLLLGYLLIWLLLLRLPQVFYLHPTVLAAWGFGQTSMIVAAAWILYVWFAGDRDAQRLRFATGDNGVRIARVLCGLALIPFGLAHFAYVKETAILIPGWLLSPLFWAYLTGATFIAAGLAILSGVAARLAATLLVAQLGGFALIVWLPRVVTRNLTAFQWGEVVVTVVLMAAAWVVADTYRGKPWLARVGP